MSDETPENRGTGGWQPIPQSEGYDGDATAFVQLPPEFMLEGVPLEAPGHGYVPPMITPLVPLAATDPAATGTWMAQTPEEPAREEPRAPHAPHASQYPQAPHVPHASQFPQAPQASQVPPVAQDFREFRELQDYPQEQTASWTIPTIEDGPDVLDDSGEYTAARLARYATGAPATLPGGAAAPWAVEEQAAGEAQPGAPVEAPEAPAGVSAEPGLVSEPVREQAPEQPLEQAPEQVVEPAPEQALEQASEQALEHAPEQAPDTLAPAPAPAPAPPPVDMSTDSDEHPTTSYTLRVNGADRPVTDSWIGESLLYVLRERLGLAGAKDGCSQGECGACNVQVDGRLVASCLVPAATAAGCEVRTVEGLAVDGEPSDVQRALAKCGVQCGFCIPGMAMTVHDLLEGNHAPNELETRQALCGNLCRCSGYRGVLDAVREVVSGREAAAEAEAGEEARIPHQIPHAFDGGTA
ncbi:2Fe-2S iron-sulfur cluster-binding protein [Streptomyces sp. NPDC050600]|uniref:2Fe-2S iron-sulfur cluster-binding protein n=1 Tax=Streptomyces sp. NPDC050600 TaxID=3157213 RepID=UPI0034131DA9